MNGKMDFQGIPVYVDPATPLERTLEDGTKEPILFLRHQNKIVIHPDRLAEFRAAADGGGLPVDGKNWVGGREVAPAKPARLVNRRGIVEADSFRLDGVPHEAGDKECPECFKGPKACDAIGCTGLKHEQFFEQSWDGYTLIYKCDACGDDGDPSI